MGKAYESLGDKEKIILTEYFKNGWKQGKAYLKAYPKAKHDTAQTEATKLFKKPYFREAKKELAQEWLDEAQDDIKTKVINLYSKRAFFDPSDIIDESGDIKEGVMNNPKLACCIDGIEVTESEKAYKKVVKLANRDKALDQLAKWQKLANETVEHTGKVELVKTQVIVDGKPVE